MSPALDYSRLADLYDHLVDWGEDLEFFRQAVKGAPGFVLELMCGTGRVSVPLLEAGVELTCVDSSPEMLDQLRHKLAVRGLSAALYEQRVTELSLPESYDLALIPFHSFEELADRSAQKQALASIRSVLVHGGRLICTLHNPLVRLREIDQGPLVFSRQTTDGELRVELDVQYDPDLGQVYGVQELVLRQSSGEEKVRRRLEIRHALIGQPEFSELAAEADFEVDCLYGNYDRSSFEPQASPFMIWILRKP